MICRVCPHREYNFKEREMMITETGKQLLALIPEYFNPEAPASLEGMEG